jgi:hypothetical protein
MSLNNKKSTHAYIYVENVKFEGFSKDNIEQLRSEGIQTSTLIYGNGDDTYREIAKMSPIEQLPQRSTPPSNNNNSGNDGTNNDAALIAGIIIIVILIIIVLGFIGYKTVAI